MLELVKECILTKNDDLLISLLHLIRVVLIYSFSNDEYEQLVRLQPSILNEAAKASFIECIATRENFMCSDELVKEYIRLISIGATTDLKAKLCLEDMLIEALDDEDLYIRLAESLEEEQAIRILVMMPQVNLDNIPQHLYDFSGKLSVARRIQERSFIIHSFLLIVHPQLNDYIDLLDLSLVYPSAEIALQDWGIQTLQSAASVVERRIFTQDEASIFLKLGQAYVKHGYIDAQLANELYDLFFEQQSPVDLIFALPDS